MTDPTTDRPACPKCSLPTGSTEGVTAPRLRCAACGHRWKATAEDRARAERADAAHEAKLRAEEAAGLWGETRKAAATGDASAPPLDLAAIDARWRRMGDLAVTRDEGGDLAITDDADADGDGYGVVARMDCDDPGFVEAAEALAGAPRDVRDLVAEVLRLRGLLDAETVAHRSDLRAVAKALDDLVGQVWRALGETHEPPARVAALLRRVAEEHGALVGFRRAMLDVCEALDGERPEPDFDMPAELGGYACDEVARLKAAVAAARREGAEAMRAACAAKCEGVALLHSPTARAVYAESVARALRTLPLPGGEP